MASLRTAGFSTRKAARKAFFSKVRVCEGHGFFFSFFFLLSTDTGEGGVVKWLTSGVGIHKDTL